MPGKLVADSVASVTGAKPRAWLRRLTPPGWRTLSTTEGPTLEEGSGDGDTNVITGAQTGRTGLTRFHKMYMPGRRLGQGRESADAQS